MWEYRAEIVHWVDGDTFDAVVDLGFHVQVCTRFRLLGVNTPERGKPGAQEATDFCRSVAMGEVVLRTAKSPRQGKFGRFLADVSLPNGSALSTTLLDRGLAVPYVG